LCEDERENGIEINNRIRSPLSLKEPSLEINKNNLMSLSISNNSDSLYEQNLA
jgi:hypothetical protein